MDDMMADVIKRGTGVRAGHCAQAQRHLRQDRHHNDGARYLVQRLQSQHRRHRLGGFDQERPLGEGEEGSRTAVPIWVPFMREALREPARSAAADARRDW